MDETGEDRNGLHLGKFEKRRPTFFQTHVSLYQNQGHLHNWKSIFSCFVAVILQMKDSCFANLTFRAHN